MRFKPYSLILFVVFLSNSAICQNSLLGTNVFIYRSANHKTKLMLHYCKSGGDTVFLQSVMIDLKDSQLFTDLNLQTFNHQIGLDSFAKNNKLNYHLLKDTIIFKHNSRFKTFYWIENKSGKEIVNFNLNPTRFPSVDLPQLYLTKVNCENSIAEFSNTRSEFIGFDTYVFKKTLWFLQFTYYDRNIGYDTYDLIMMNSEYCNLYNQIHFKSCDD